MAPDRRNVRRTPDLHRTAAWKGVAGGGRGGHTPCSAALVSTFAIEDRRATGRDGGTHEGRRARGKAQGHAKVLVESTSVTQIILHEAARRGLGGDPSADVILSLVLDFTPDQLRHDKREGLLPRYLGNWTNFTSCLDTAVRMFGLLGQGAAAASGAATRNDQASIGTTTTNLVAAVRGVGNGSGLFRVAYGIHGFTIAMGGGQAELVQSFAGSATGDMLATFLRQGKVYTVAQLATLLGNMTNSSRDVRRPAQEALFDGEVEDRDNTWPNVAFSWEQKGLKHLSALIADIGARLDENMKTIAGAKPDPDEQKLMSTY